MTAEIAIANAGAIALAADSAVTIRGQKIYNSALKLFALSKVAPVGIMVYGNADLMGVPWETLIKTYRNELKDTRFDTVAEYATGFIKFLNDHPSAFPEDSQRMWIDNNTRAFYQFMRGKVLKKLHPILKEKGKVEATTVNKLFVEIVNYYHKKLLNEEFAEDLTEKEFKKIRDKYRGLFKQIRDEIFEEVRISPTLTAKLYDIAAFLHVKQIFPSDTSGLVVAGYGESELYPSLIVYEIGGMVENKFKYRKNDKKCHTITSGQECSITAFAQEDMVHTFMHGINPSILDLMATYLRGLFQRLPELLDENLELEHRENFTKKSAKLLEDFFTDLSGYIRGNHTDPVFRTVTALPKDELAAMAESLVNLTAFKRRITESIETVGGPIDVVVISKGDGLVWVKRKHYFPAELNQHFFKNYFRGISNGE